MKKADEICHTCGEVVPNPLPPGAKIWHPPIPRSDGQWVAAVKGVGVTGMERCRPPPLDIKEDRSVQQLMEDGDL